MNYIYLINGFYDRLETNPVSASAIVLWHALVHINNKAGWIKEFAVALSVLGIKTSLSERTIINARNELQQKKYIQFKGRKGNKSAMYLLVNLYANNSHSISDNPSDNPSDNVSDSLSYNVSTLNKLNKTKLNETKDKKSRGTKKFVPPSLLDVKNYCVERNNNVDPQKFIDFYESKGWYVGKNKMKCWQASVRTWEKRENNKPDKKNQENSGNIFFDILKEEGKM